MTFLAPTDSRLHRFTPIQWQALADQAKYQAKIFIKLSGESAWTVSRLCLIRWRISLCDWLWQERIKIACDALASGESTKDVALMVCYCRTVAHFCNQFKKRMGLSPQEYARKYRTPRNADLTPKRADSEIGAPMPPISPRISASL